MATEKTTVARTFSVRGRIFNSTTNNGLSDLIVSIFDAGSGPEDSERIGSVATDANGSFAFNYDDDDIAALKRDKDRLDLVVTVSAPDTDGRGSSKGVMYASEPRAKAGRVENFNVGLSAATLKKFGLDGGADTKSSVEAYKRERTIAKDFNAAVVEFHQAEIERDIEEKHVVRDELIKTIGTNLDLAVFPGEVVRGGDTINDKSAQVAKKGVDVANLLVNGINPIPDNDPVETTGVPVSLYLLPDDLDRLRPFFDAPRNGFAEIPESALLDVLSRTNSSENPGTLLIHNNPIASYCVEQSVEQKCARKHTGDEADPHGPSDPAGGNGTEPSSGPLTDDNVREIAARLTADMLPPEFVFGDSFNAPVATKDLVDRSVSDFALGKGPADVPAFYDFVSLQVAFEHVWKVLIDEHLVKTAHEAEKKLRERTGVGVIGSSNRSWFDMLTDGVSTSFVQEVPAAVAAQFDVTLQEYVDLSASHRARLEQIANALSGSVSTHLEGPGWSFEDLIPDFFGGIGASGGRRRLTMLQKEKLRQDLREQGERIIDSVRHDDYYTLHKTLRDLQARVNSAYEFTVFAADKNQHSVNFGLMNTYRQKWAPINYQAGKLIKTIPLSPKEERKYAVKTNRSHKQVKKEAIKNSSSQASEQTSTSRVEAEIMEKALSKTNFTLSTDGSYNIGISKGKGTTTFGVEAQNEATASRKDFREAVLKAVQEYKDERSVEIDSEEIFTSEYSESGTIVNPNDELSVTYLFYELQRRYRVSEELYRVMPVVLVAQEVPAPHEITEAWVIAHDWIINRFLLDDSFRPTLHYLANRSVGDDFALRELRKNLRQQRNLIETLRIELSSSSDEAENRYRALENAIERRIQEEEAENSDGLFSDVGDFFGGGGQNPEAMKARELAAKDSHQYAVEKAGKAAAALKEEVNTLHRLTSEYNLTLRTHLDNETRTKRLLAHLRSNIFHYMQAIWSMEPPDQRFLRLHKVEVPILKFATVNDPASGRAVPDRKYFVRVKRDGDGIFQPVEADDVFSSFREPGTKKFRAFLKGRILPAGTSRPRSLVEVADLDTLLGFKGNYMIFPLKEHNALTEFMAAPYVDQAFGAMDPNELANVNLEDYAKFICCLHHNTEPEEFEKLKPELKKWLERLLADPLRNGDEVVVPTGSLFIESLVGTYPLLENFKKRHREMDARKVAEEVRRAQMENLRLAARLVNAERDDPDVEKKIVVEGRADPTIDVDS